MQHLRPGGLSLGILRFVYNAGKAVTSETSTVFGQLLKRPVYLGELIFHMVTAPWFSFQNCHASIIPVGIGFDVSDSELEKISMGNDENVIRVKSTAYLPLAVPELFQKVGLLEREEIPGLLKFCFIIKEGQP